MNNELGFAYYFCYHFSTYKIEKPEGFDREEAASWETGYESAPDAADVNVVFVMNEAFSDILNEDVFVFPEGENPMEVYNTLAEGENAWAATSWCPISQAARRTRSSTSRPVCRRTCSTPPRPRSPPSAP